MKKEDLQKKSDAIVKRAVKIRVVDRKTLARAEDALVEVKDFINGVNEYFEAPIAKAHSLHKELVKKRSDARDPLLKAERFLKDAIRDFLVAEERKRQEEEERRRFEQEAMLSKMQEQKDKGDEAAAEETFGQIEKLHEEDLKVYEAPKTEGVIQKKRVKWRVADLDLVPRKYLTIDKPLVDEVVRRLKLEANIPGIEVYEDVEIAAKRR